MTKITILALHNAYDFFSFGFGSASKSNWYFDGGRFFDDFFLESVPFASSLPSGFFSERGAGFRSDFLCSPRLLLRSDLAFEGVVFLPLPFP